MNNEIANLLIQYRKEKNLSQRQLAKILNVNNAYISRIEKGEIKKLSINLLFEISKELKVDYINLLFNNYNYEELEGLGVFNSNINDSIHIIDEKILKNFLIEDENKNTRISLKKTLEEFKKDNISIKETIGILSCITDKNLFNYLTQSEIKDIDKNK